MSGKSSDVAAIEELLGLFGSLRLRHCPLTPTPRQEAFLLLRELEVFFGGGAGGGKSVALLMAALQYVDVPGYDALLLRPSLAELQLAGGLIELSHDWLAGRRASWSAETKTWRFPGPGRSGTGGASLGFGYLSDGNDLLRYSGSSYSFVGFDELTRISEVLYRRMFRVLRQPTGADPPAAPDGTRLADVPIRIRATSNPGGPGHAWVKQRFVDPATREPDVIYLPSRLTDNPHLNHDEYAALLAELPSAERARLLTGDWEIPDDGELFQRDWFQLIEPHQVPERTRAVRYWDLAGTEPSSANRDPDYTVGLRLELHSQSGNFYITDIVRERKAPGAIEQLVAATAKRDGRTIPIRIEQEPGASGKALAARYKRQVLRGYTVGSSRVTGPKDVRARPVAAAAENGLIHIVRGRHTNDFLDELTAFPHGAHDDCVDALAGAHTHLATSGPTIVSIHNPNRYRISTDMSQPWMRRRALSIDEIASLVGARVYPSPADASEHGRARWWS
jgi:predicted phage terminase large subunit-like protein